MQFLRNLFGSKSNQFKTPRSVAEIPDYAAAYEQAHRFTRSLGFAVPDPAPFAAGKDLLPKDGGFLEPVFLAAGVRDPSQAAGQCLKWCHYLQPFFQDHLGAPVTLTIGQLWKGDSSVFNPGFDDITRWTKRGLGLEDMNGGNGFQLHAWLTVETGEIIEPTLLSSLATFGADSFRQFAGATVWGRDPYVLQRHRYFPMAVGGALVEQIASRSPIPLLARNASELGLSGAIVFQ